MKTENTYLSMILFLLILTTKENNIGIDLGSFFTKAAISDGSSAPIIADDCDSQVKTYSFAAIKSNDDIEVNYIGKNAFNMLKMSSGNVIGFFSAIIGLSKQELENLSKKFVINVNFGENDYKSGLTLFLKDYLEYLQENKTNHLTIAVPSFFTVNQIAILSNAIELCGIKNFSIIDEIDSISYLYIAEKDKAFYVKPKSILFIDIGATSIRAYILKFYMKKRIKNVERISYSFEKMTGGYFITLNLAEYIIDKIGINDLSNIDKQKIIVEAEKAKIQLSIFKNANLLIKNISNTDYNITISRNEFENLEIFKSIEKSILNVTERLTQKFNFDEIQLLGGSFKIQKIQQIVKNMFDINNINDSINTDDTISAGACYYSNDLSVYNISYNDPSIYSVKVNQVEICKKGDKCITNINLSTNRIKISYEPCEFLDEQESYYQIYDVPNSFPRTIVSFSTNPFQISLINNTKMHLIIHNAFKLSNQVNKIIELKNYKKDVKTTKINIEELSSKIIHDLSFNNSIIFFTNHKQRSKIFKVAKEEKRWISTGSAQECNDLKKLKYHLSKLKKSISNLYRRIHENTTFYDNVNDLYETLGYSTQVVTQIRDQNLHKSPKKLFIFLEKAKKCEDWVNESITKNQHAVPWKFLPVRPIEFLKKKREVLYDYVEIFQSLTKYTDETGKLNFITEGQIIQDKIREGLKNNTFSKEVDKIIESMNKEL